jgi:hypothetical protein
MSPKELTMKSDQITFQLALSAERARLWMLVREDIAALRQLVAESQQIMDAILHSREIDTSAEPAEQDSSA